MQKQNDDLLYRNRQLYNCFVNPLTPDTAVALLESTKTYPGLRAILPESDHSICLLYLNTFQMTGSMSPYENWLDSFESTFVEAILVILL